MARKKRSGEAAAGKRAGRNRRPRPVPAAASKGRVSAEPDRQPVSFLRRHRRSLEILGVVLVIAIGLLVRLEDLRDWRNHPERSFYQQQPLLTTFDGYYYLSLARDLVDGTYRPVDKMRGVPDYPSRPTPPPLLSVTAAAITKLTPFSLDWIGAVLPALLGVLLALPLYFLGRYYGGPVMGLSASLFALMSGYYVYRSSFGWFDTDCMIVTWSTTAIWFFLKFGVESGRRRYLFLAAGLAVYLIFLWWWDQTPEVTTAVALLPLAVALLFFYRPSRREGLLLAGLAGAVLLALLCWKGFSLPLEMLKGIFGKFQYIAKESTGNFPNIGLTISEQNRPGFQEIVEKTAGSLPVFLFAGAGLGLLFYRRPKESLFLSVPFILGFLSFLFAKRFMIFLAPITALGAGYLVSRIWQWKGLRWMPAVAAGLVLVLAWPAFSRNMDNTFWPIEPPWLVKGMAAARTRTPKDAVIWAWWDHGYPLIYYARRGTINDGAIHGGERSVYNALPLATGDFRLAANFMRFYVARGMSGIQGFYRAAGGDLERGYRLMRKILAAGPVGAVPLIRSAALAAEGDRRTVDEWLEFFFPAKSRPVYLYVDQRLTRTSYWWFWLGSWDIAKKDGIHPYYRTFYRLQHKQQLVFGNGRDAIDFGRGIFRLEGNRAINLREACLNDGRQLRLFQYSQARKYCFEFLQPAGFGALEEKAIAESVFNRLFIRQSAPAEYFRPLDLDSPSYQLWEVRGDRLDGQARDRG